MNVRRVNDGASDDTEHSALGRVRALPEGSHRQDLNRIPSPPVSDGSPGSMMTTPICFR